jgi:hypothetical protein
MDDSSKYHHSTMQLRLRRMVQSPLCWLLGLFMTLGLAIAFYRHSSSLISAFSYSPSGALLEQQVASLLSKSMHSGVSFSSSLAADLPQLDHEQRITAEITENRQLILSKRPALVAEPPDGHDMPYDNLLAIVERWHPDDPEVPADFQERLQHFNWGNPQERLIAEKYRDMEIPFKIFNVSDFEDVSRKWSDAYLRPNLKAMSGRVHAEKSKNNHVS